MRHLIKLVIVLAIAFVVVGFWEGWFSLTSGPTTDPNTNKTNLNMTFDKDKMKADLKTAKDKVKEKVKEIREDVKAARTAKSEADKTKDAK